MTFWIFPRESHLAANPGAVVGEEAYTEYAKVGAPLFLYLYLVFVFYVCIYVFNFSLTLQDEDDSEQILTFSEIPNEEYPLYPAG